MRVRERENSKTLFYKDRSLGLVKNLSKQLVLSKLLLNKYKITGIIYIHLGMNERVKFYT